MRKFGLLVAILVQLATGPAAAADLAGQPAPDFALKSVAGDNLRLSEYRGDVVMINFWASWCGDCREAMPALNDLYRRYREVGFELLSVNMDRKWDDAEEMARSLKMENPVLFDDGQKVSRLYDVEAMPVTVLVDREGVVRHINRGYRRGGEQLFLEQLRALLRE